MTLNPLVVPTPSKLRAVRLALIAGCIALAFLSAGDRRVFSAIDGDVGIDPLDVLTTKVRPNIYLVVDSSVSMAQFSDESVVSNNKVTATEDEPNSKLAQAKAVLKKLVQENQGIANFALARYQGQQATLPATNKFFYSTDSIDFSSITTTTAQFDLRQFSVAAATIPFVEAGTNRSTSLAAGNFNTGWDLAAAVQAALNATTPKTNTYKVTFVDAPGGTDARFTIGTTNVGPVPFTIKGTTMTAAFRNTFGLSTDVSTSSPSLTPPSNGTTSYSPGAADPFTFTENGTTRNASLPSGTYTTSALLVTALQNALNAAAGKTNTYAVAFVSSKYVISTTNGGAVAFAIDGGTFLPAARTAFGFANATMASTAVVGSVSTSSQPSGAEVAMTASRNSSFNATGRGRTGVNNTQIDWLVANKFFADMTLRVGPDGTPCGIIPAGTPSVTSAQISVQAMTSCDPTASPTAVGTPYTFKLAGTDWDDPPFSCTGLDPLQSMAACTNVDMQIDAIGPFLEPSLKVSDVDPNPLVATPGIAGYSDGFLGQIVSLPDATLPLQKGIRMNAATPIAESLIGLFKEFNTLWLSALVSQPVGKRQKNFVIFVTDGDDTCETTTANPATVSTANLGQHALRAAYVAEELYKGVQVAASTATRATGTTWPPATGARDPESKVTTFVVVFGAAVQTVNANAIAWGGSGMTRTPLTGSSFGLRWSTAPADKTGCPTCRDAFTASNADQLAAAIQSAINLTQEGEFSDQQSVTETIYEYVKLAPTPAPTVPPTPTPAAQDPANALSRYSRTVPVILQSTFLMPDFQGHLTAFRNNGTSIPEELWDAGQKLQNRVLNGVSGTDGMGAGEYDFTALKGNATLDFSNTPNVKGSSAKIKRRIFSTRVNGRLTVSEYNPATLVSQDSSPINGPGGGFERVALWPPSAAVSPTDSANSPGILDTVLGLTAAVDLPAVQLLVPDACKGATAGSCTGGTAATQLAKSKREAREILLAWLAGATPARTGPDPKRVSNEIVYVARSWVMAESTLAAPAVVAPPPQAESTDFKRDEYLLYRDGPRNLTGAVTGDPCAPSLALAKPECLAINGIPSGLGLRNPDLDGTSVDGTFAAQALPGLKPIMSVVYHATNAGLHAFRAGPCPSTATYSPIGATLSFGCAGELGGEELWAFVPFDQLPKLPKLLLPQKNDANKVYMLAAPVRFSDIWIDGGWTKTFSGSPSKTVSGTGVWRTLAFFGRGAGGKFMTGMDITVPGTVGTHTLDTTLPVLLWNRGNPDAFDPTNYGKMGQTWSVPSIGRVVSADFGNNDHVLFVGSGYSAVASEGASFFVMSPRNGDIIQAFSNIGNGTSATFASNPAFKNKLVASPSLVSELADGRSPLDAIFLGNPAGALTKSVYFPDLHSRIWKYSTTTPFSDPVLFADARQSTGQEQPFANSVALLRFYPTPLPSPASSPVPPPTVHVFAEAGNDHRVARPVAAPFFQALGYRDEGSYPATPFLFRNFPSGYRGQVQPATAFAGSDKPVVFFAANQFTTTNAGCISQFNGILYALNAATNAAAFNLSASDPTATSDESVTLADQRITAIRVAGSKLVVDTGLRANIAPPPPEAPTTGQTSTVGASTATVSQGADPGNPAHAGFRTTTVPFRTGTSSCRANQ